MTMSLIEMNRLVTLTQTGFFSPDIDALIHVSHSLQNMQCADFLLLADVFLKTLSSLLFSFSHLRYVFSMEHDALFSREHSNFAFCNLPTCRDSQRLRLSGWSSQWFSFHRQFSFTAAMFSLQLYIRIFGMTWFLM